jgi:chromodomain-helicase-DNA-binding protein 1
MAFFSNSGSRADSGRYNLNEKAEDESVYEVRDDEVDLNSRQWNLNEKADDYHNEEQYEAGQSGLNSSGNTSGQHARGGGGSSGGLWGTSFFKDSRSKQMDEVALNSAMGMEDGFAASSHDDMDGSGEDEELDGGNMEVPVEEMLSDDYYEQDGEEQSESLHHGGTKLPSCSTSGAVAKSSSRQKKKLTKYNMYDDDDDDDEYNDENDDDDDADGIFNFGPLC